MGSQTAMQLGYRNSFSPYHITCSKRFREWTFKNRKFKIWIILNGEWIPLVARGKRSALKKPHSLTRRR